MFCDESDFVKFKFVQFRCDCSKEKFSASVVGFDNY